MLWRKKSDEEQNEVNHVQIRIVNFSCNGGRERKREIETQPTSAAANDTAIVSISSSSKLHFFPAIVTVWQNETASVRQGIIIIYGKK